MEEMSVDMKMTPALNKVIEKDTRVLSSLSSAISRNTLLSHLSLEDRNQISECMFLCTAKAGEVIIQQGDQGDNFYIIDQGKVTIQVLDTQNEIMNFNVAEGGSFGELALIYGTPRAATVKAASDIILYGMTRESFRKILLESAFGKRKKYEDFISHIPILEHLDKWQRLAVVDLLQEKQFPPEETVVKQGEDGEMFYFIISGQAKVTMFRLDGGEEQQVNLLGPGDSFGELALLNDKPRAATVTAISRLNCAVIDKDGFERGLAPCSDMFKQQGLQYKSLPTNQKPKK